MTKNSLKLEAIKLRRNGLSYLQISKSLNVSKSTVSVWLSGLAWSQKIVSRLQERSYDAGRKRLLLIAVARKKQTFKSISIAKIEAKKFFGVNKDNNIFLLGLAIYWGEGDKQNSNGLVRMSNIDQMMIKKFVVFLRKICKVPVEKIKFWLLLYNDLDEGVCKNFWQKEVGISPEQFVKSQYIVGRHKKRRVSYGVCNLYVSNRLLKEKILTWIELLGKM